MGYGTTDVTVLSPDELPSDLYASPSGTSRPAGRPPRTLDAYFVSGERLARAVRVREAFGSRLEDALQALIEGPSPSERAAGISSAIPAGVELLQA